MSTVKPFSMFQNDNGTLTIGTDNGQKPYVQVSQNGIVTLPQQPAFSAFASQNFNFFLDNNATLNFNHVVDNRGDCYDPITSVFTAPVKAMYDFKATVFISDIFCKLQPGQGVSVILKAGKIAYEAVCHFGTSLNYGLACNISNMVFMNATDTASILLKFAIPSEQQCQLILEGSAQSPRCMFSGHLVS